VVVDHVGILVLAHHQVPVRRHREVVAEVELLLRGALVEQLQPVLARGLRPQPEHLPELGRAAAGAAEVELAVTHVDALAAREQRRARRRAALPQVVVGRLNVVERDPAHRLPGLRREGDAGPVARIGQALDRQRVQRAALGQPPLHLGHEAVQQPVLAILGQVHRAGARIDACRLVVEAPIAFSGTASTGSVAAAGTSNT
jgi:hypothetical protein